MNYYLINRFSSYFKSFSHRLDDLIFSNQYQTQPSFVNSMNFNFADTGYSQPSEPTQSVFDLVILHMGVPKSKITPARKKLKSIRHTPQKIGWYTCKKCGEPKRPHRICTKNLNICAIKQEDWEKMQAKELI